MRQFFLSDNYVLSDFLSNSFFIATAIFYDSFFIATTVSHQTVFSVAAVFLFGAGYCSCCFFHSEA